MYAQSKAYLLEKIRACGLESNPYATEKTLEKNQESHVSIVLFKSEALARNGSKTRFRDQEGAQHKRRKVFDRKLSFTVMPGDYTDEAVEAIYEKLFAGPDSSMYINGDYTPIEVESAGWVDKDDSILKAKVAVQVKITFDGGLYRDTNFARVREPDVVSVTKNNGKEPIGGSETEQP